MSGRHRDIGRQHPSGRAKRKAKDEKEKRDSLVISKTRKINDFFSGSSSQQIQPGTISEESVLDQESSESEQEFPLEANISPASVATSRDGVDAVESPSVTQIETDGEGVETHLPPDLGLWPETVDATNQDFWISKGSETCQNIDADFSLSQQTYKQQTRFCTKSLFVHQHKLTKETTKRSWLCYSPSKASLFCFSCKVTNVKGNQFAEGGFSDWSHAAQRVQSHEQSSVHRDSLISILNRQSVEQRIDSQLTQEMMKEREYWTQVLERVVAVFVLSTNLV